MIRGKPRASFGLASSAMQALCAIALVLLPVERLNAGIQLGKLRVIYAEGISDATIPVTNVGTVPVIVQTWVESADGGPDTPFFATPPMFRLDPDNNNLIRIMLVGPAPATNVERMYWLNVKEIPPEPDSGTENTLQFAFRTRIKLLYRPGSVKGALDGTKDLVLDATTASSDKTHPISIRNRSRFVASLIVTCLTNQRHAPLTIFPKRSAVVPDLSCSTAAIRIQTINDYGGISTTIRPVSDEGPNSETQ